MSERTSFFGQTIVSHLGTDEFAADDDTIIVEIVSITTANEFMVATEPNEKKI